LSSSRVDNIARAKQELAVAKKLDCELQDMIDSMEHRMMHLRAQLDFRFVVVSLFFL